MKKQKRARTGRKNYHRVNKQKARYHFFLPEDQGLFDYDYIFSASALWVDLGMRDVEATFDLVVRDMPSHRNFLLFTGLEEILSGILNWKFSEEDIRFLRQRKIITPRLAKMLKSFRADFDVWAMKEGTVFFPGEPVIRMTGKLWKINLLTFFLMNSISSNTVFSTKMVRGFLAAEDKIYVATCSPVRGHAHEAALKFGRIAYLFGSASGMVPGFARKFDIPYESKARGFHAFIKSFPSELEAMRNLVSVFPDASVMIDTYGLTSGLKNAIKVAKEQKAKGTPVFSAVFLDSGKNAADYARQARMIRKALDDAGLQEIQITAAGNFQEYKIAELVKLQAPIDKVILGTEFIAPADDPKIEVVLKMAQFVQDGKVTHTAKLAEGKESYPGIKQVFRKYRGKTMTGDVIGLASESHGKPLLHKMMTNGISTYRLPELDEIKSHMTRELATLPPRLKRIDQEAVYSVKKSQKLEALFARVKEQHTVRNHGV